MSVAVALPVAFDQIIERRRNAVAFVKMNFVRTVIRTVEKAVDFREAFGKPVGKLGLDAALELQ